MDHSTRSFYGAHNSPGLLIHHRRARHLGRRGHLLGPQSVCVCAYIGFRLGLAVGVTALGIYNKGLGVLRTCRRRLVLTPLAEPPSVSLSRAPTVPETPALSDNRSSSSSSSISSNSSLQSHGVPPDPPVGPPAGGLRAPVGPSHHRLG